MAARYREKALARSTQVIETLGPGEQEVPLIDAPRPAAMASWTDPS